ncbi:MAG: MerR family transcriptional regulator [Anaerorhabdus sp.]|uniref:MerR family transcriptional regulator n=1 Tax=Anaerorhabdus sp. TaxID=1872524 RepID=UPI003A8B366F
MFRIGEFAKMGQVSIKTLRYYDEIDLLKPQEIDVMTNYRYYTTKQLVQLHEIQFYRQIGCSIQDIKKIINGGNEIDILICKRQETLNEISRLNQQMKQINYRIESERIMEYKAIIKEIPAYTIYAKKMTVSNYADYAKVIPEIGEAMMGVNPDLKCVTPEYCYISYLGETGDDVN